MDSYPIFHVPIDRDTTTSGVPNEPPKEKYKKQFSHNMMLRDREYLANWIRAVRSYDQPEDDHYLHHVGISVFTAIGKLQDGEYRRELFGRLTVIDRQRARNKVHTESPNSV